MKLAIDKGTALGSLVALAAIAAGLALDGGHLTQVMQPSAALIVLGGTLGAVLVQFPLSVVLQALRSLRQVISPATTEPESLMKDLLRYAHKARRDGLVSLDAELNRVQDPFLRESLMLAIDGVNLAELRQIMELRLDYRAEKDERVPKVFEAAAGYSPTIGILGAVLGLIQVMQQLQDISAVGRGIAAAFVATLYGVGAANLVFLPLAGKLRIRLRERQVMQEMVLAAVIAIAEGVNPRSLEVQLTTCFPAAARQGSPKLPILSRVASR